NYSDVVPTATRSSPPRRCHTPSVGFIHRAGHDGAAPPGQRRRTTQGEDPVERDKALAMAMGQIEKQYGKGSVMKMGEKGTMAIEVVSTGSIALDVALGVGGLPRGRVTEIYGPESSGKSTLAMHVVAE